MADVVDLEGVLAKLRPFSPLRRLLLATAGTLQGTLSGYFGSPVSVAVREQRVSEEGFFHRVVDLVCDAHNVAVCRAVSEVEVTDSRIHELVSQRHIGLGQISAALDLPTSFTLHDAGADDSSFWRHYRLVGAGFAYDITERFPMPLYPDIPEALETASQ